MNPHQFSIWSHALTHGHIGNDIALDFTGKNEWYEIVSIIFDEDGVSVIAQVTDDFDVVKLYDEPALVHLMWKSEDD